MLNMKAMKPSQKVNETRASLHDSKTHFGRVSKADDKPMRAFRNVSKLLPV